MMTMVMMKMASPKTNPNIPVISTTISPTWKLYENPYYIFHHQETTTTTDQCSTQRQIHRLHLPVSSRKIAASFLDLAFMKPLMESELEALNKRLAREVAEERRGREALERVCRDLADQICAHKAEMAKMRRDMEEERKMLRTAEVIREERVQMKLSEANHFLQERLSDLQINQNPLLNTNRENPHIKRGIKGFVEFPKLACTCTTKHFGTKLESQKAQLKHNSLPDDL